VIGDCVPMPGERREIGMGGALSTYIEISASYQPSKSKLFGKIEIIGTQMKESKSGAQQ
jgi:hypothetical protein